MRIKYNETKKGRCYYIIQSVYKNGKNTTETYEKLGYPDDIKEKYKCSDPMKWLDEHIGELNAQTGDKKGTTVLVPLNAHKKIPVGEKRSFNVGYLFLQQIYYDLKLPNICRSITRQHHFDYDLNEILSRLIYERILFPSSKLEMTKKSCDLLEPSSFQYHQVIRSLSVLAEEFDDIQAKLYRYSAEVIPRNTGVLYYDCTNFYFEIEQEKGIRKYGYSKEHRPNPIVQMGLFMDYSGIPLAITIDDGNKNEQQTLKPLEETILTDFGLSKFVVCTDAGLSSEPNRMFNNFGERSFITTQSIKKLDKKQREWCLKPTGWLLSEDKEKKERPVYDIREIDATDELREKNWDKIYYKEKLIEGYDEERDITFNQTIIVSYSLKYKDYLEKIRDGQIERAMKAIAGGGASEDRRSQTDYRRLIARSHKTSKGEEATTTSCSINQDVIDKEKQFDGFYAVCTNLDDDVEDIINVNRGRWEIEESFRIMKSEFDARPVHLQRDDRIKAHFMTCFISLLIYRILERKIGSQYTCGEICTTLRDMCVTRIADKYYVPSYTSSKLTNELHETAGLRTDYEVIRDKEMRGIIRRSKGSSVKK